ncbi:hypothetical protein BGX28_006028 [Mortierella sp. GBA30]|nr:hypothetical protein BGX28_006028 [Mortierella sp. GBA30]
MLPSWSMIGRLHHSPRHIPATALDIFISKAGLHSSAPRSRILVQWTPELDSRIRQLRGQGQTWKEIGITLNMPPITCYRRYRSTIEPMLSNFWSLERIQQLRELVLGSRRSWKEIAQELATGQKRISPMACQQQWYSMTQGSIRREGNAHEFRQQDREAFQRHVSAAAAVAVASETNRPLVFDWEKVARTIFEGRFTVEQLQFQQSLYLRESHRWTKNEDTVLLEQIMKETKKGATRSTATTTMMIDETGWSRISKDLGSHSAEECRARWRRLWKLLVKKNKISKSGNHWSLDEVRAYWKAWQAFGNDWDKVSTAVRDVRGIGPTGDRISIDEAGTEAGSAPLLKTAKDCEDDFLFLVRESASKMDALQDDLGDLAFELTSQPRRRVQWSPELQASLEKAVTENMTTLAGNSGDTLKEVAIGDINWSAVARAIGHSVTGAQCRYRWGTSKGPVVASGSQRRAVQHWDPKEVSQLMRALRDLKVLGSAVRLPSLSSRFIQKEYSLSRTTSQIRYKAKKILEEHAPWTQDAERVPESKAVLNLPMISTDTASEKDNRMGFNRRVSFLQEHGGLDHLENREEDEDSIEEKRHLHPQMFIAPGIPKTESDRAFVPGSKRRRRTPFVWQPEDEDKLEQMVRKYGQSTLGWKQISVEMLIPVRKCKDKWRYLKATQFAE